MDAAYVTFRPDNYLTIGLIGLTVYLGAVLLVQLAGRAGLVNLQTAAPTIPAGAVVTS